MKHKNIVTQKRPKGYIKSPKQESSCNGCLFVIKRGVTIDGLTMRCAIGIPLTGDYVQGLMYNPHPMEPCYKATTRDKARKALATVRHNRFLKQLEEQLKNA